MIVRPTAKDQGLIAYYTAKVVTGVGLLMLVPLAVSLLFGEWDTALDFGIGAAASLTVGLGGQAATFTTDGLMRRHGFVVVAVSWFTGSFFAAIPFKLSGHYGSFVDCYFDVMSGLTTTGLYLLQDLDHVAVGLNTWRFLLTFVGGQGIVVLALTFLFRGVPGAFALSSGEGKEERLVPHAVGTARLIWLVSLAWLFVGTVVMTAVLLYLGEAPIRALTHGLWMFMGAFSTGGFAPQSYNAFWYHSGLFEMVTAIVMFAGSLNFAVHWAAWTGKPGELLRNIETRSFAVTLTMLLASTTYALGRIGIYPDAVVMFRKVFYQLVSGHTTTGFGTIYSRTLVVQWGPLAMLGIIASMMIGGSACSTAGGIKGFRMGVITKSFVRNIKEMLGPDSSVVTERYHHVREQVLTDVVAQNALTITVIFFTTYALITALGVAYGYPLIESAFDGISAASNTGLSCGLLTPTMPLAMKLGFTLGMWLGRLEFLAIFALVGWIWASVRGR